MNKRLFVLICSVILFQYIYNDNPCKPTEETITEFTKAVCNERDGDGETKICVLEVNGEGAATGCKLEVKGSVPCEDVVVGATNDLCQALKLDNTDDYKCVKDGTACKKKIKECKEGKGSSDDECKKFSTASGYVCKQDPDSKTDKKCKEFTSSSYSLKCSFALLIFLFLF